MRLLLQSEKLCSERRRESGVHKHDKIHLDREACALRAVTDIHPRILDTPGSAAVTLPAPRMRSSSAAIELDLLAQIRSIVEKVLYVRKTLLLTARKKHTYFNEKRPPGRHRMDPI